MGQEERRDELFSKWRDAKDEELWVKCDNCIRDLLSTLQEGHPIRKDLQKFYNEINNQVKTENSLIQILQKNTHPLKREGLNSYYSLVSRWWAGELYTKFYETFLQENLIIKEK